ncbi:hypothetical protein AX17_005274 [Amanita inopinata Kibby_2008]|nr:hypothetical protein AX17_005274 [Amanita inopinata Kibby_2008]
MQSNTNTPETAPYTILRIKRKRNEEPLDALVVDSPVQRKRSRGGIQVFQFAQTVEDDAWKDVKQQKDIKDQISKLTREASNREESKQSNGQQPGRTGPAAPRQQQQGGVVKRRYTVLENGPASGDSPKRIKMPPAVILAKDAAKAVQADFRLYDAIPSHEQEETQTVTGNDIDKFLPLLNDYLTRMRRYALVWSSFNWIPVHNISLDKPELPRKKEPILASRSAMRTPKPDTGDYVWDVFYVRPAATLDEWRGMANVATLTGLPRECDDLYGSSDSEPEDEADEDSNAEEYYKNDYPEEEELSGT